MLPAIRTNGNLYDIPKFDLKVPDVKSFAKELKGFHSQFASCFSRAEPRDNFYQYMAGQFSKLERKSIEPIAASMVRRRTSEEILEKMQDTKGLDL